MFEAGADKIFKVLKTERIFKWMPVVDVGIGLGKVTYEHWQKGDLGSPDYIADSASEVVKWGVGLAVGMAAGAAVAPFIAAGVATVLISTAVGVGVGIAYDAVLNRRVKKVVKAMVS